MSVEPPAGHGTISVTGLVGNCCDCAVPVNAARGGGAVLVLRDISDLRHADQVRRDFVANVSHELRTPLTILSGFLETIRELDLDPARTRDYLALMAAQSERMQRIVDDLLTLSTLESAAEPSLDERVRVRPLLDRLVAEAEALSGGKHRIALTVETDCELIGAEIRAGAFDYLKWFPHGNRAAEFLAAAGAIGKSNRKEGRQARTRGPRQREFDRSVPSSGAETTAAAVGGAPSARLCARGIRSCHE